MPKLLNFIQKPAYGSGLRSEKNAIGQPTLFVYGAIDDFFGVSAESFVKALSALENDTIHLRINSAGGCVFQAKSMQTAIAEHPAKIVAHVDGLAASAATFLLLGADERRITEGGFVMIHKPFGIVGGQAKKLRDQADVMDQIEQTAIKDYVKLTGVSHEKIEEWVAAETWFSATDARKTGFVDYIDSGQAIKNCVYNLSAYQHPPKALRNRGMPTAQLRARELQLIGIHMGEDDV